MPKDVSSNIYGYDLNDFAEGISSDALISKVPSDDIADYWGKTVDQSAVSKGNKKDPGEAKSKNVGAGKDDRACTEGNHGKQGCNE